jgi:D-alanine-D-alanine ligase
MNIAVIFGGESCEHDISIITGEQLISKANEYLYSIYPIYIDKKGKWLTGESLKDIDSFSNELKGVKECAFLPNDANLYIKKGKKYKKLVCIDMAFVCLHGLRGEDGTVASVLELSKIPYSSSSILASSTCMDKCVFKSFARGLNVNVIYGFDIRENQFLVDYKTIEDKCKEIGFPIILKPSRQGSSIGIDVCESVEELHNKLKNSFNYDNKLLIEKFVDVKKEVNIAVFENKGELIYSNTEEPLTKDKILSFDNKYRKNSGGFETIKRIVPADITKDQEQYIRDCAKRIYKELEMFGIVRFDFIVSNDDEVFLNEVNTIPGSMANYLFDKQKYSYPKLIDIIISNALFRAERESKIMRVFDSGVLTNDFDGFKK